MRAAITENNTDTTTFVWIDWRDSMIEVDMPHDMARAIMAGERPFPSSEECPRREFNHDDSTAVLKARNDQIDARRGELVTQYPALKSQR